MPSNRQKTLGFVRKYGNSIRIRGKGLIHPSSSLEQRFKTMALMEQERQNIKKMVEQ